jgi:hypothetical protein
VEATAGTAQRRGGGGGARGPVVGAMPVVLLAPPLHVAKNIRVGITSGCCLYCAQKPRAVYYCVASGFFPVCCPRCLDLRKVPQPRGIGKQWPTGPFIGKDGESYFHYRTLLTMEVRLPDRQLYCVRLCLCCVCAVLCLPSPPLASPRPRVAKSLIPVATQRA